MAKIRLKLGTDELEIDSRDFYADNHTLGEVVESMARSLQECRPEPLPEPAAPLEGLDDAEAFEPEFAAPVPVSFPELREKLRFLEAHSFFETPRTVSETAEQLREHGWSANLLDVSKALAKMAFGREIFKDSDQHRSLYSAKKTILSN